MRRLDLLAGILLAAMLGPCMADGEPIPLFEKSGATLYLAGHIEGYGDTEFLLDTGASYMTVNAELLKTLERGGHAEYLRRLAGTFADGRRRAIPIYRISGIMIGDCHLRDVEAAVLPGGVRNILGLSALRRTSAFTLTMNPPELSLTGCEEPRA